MVMYEEGFSQGRIEGRDGSNACSFIAVIFAYLFLKERVTLLEETPVFNDTIFDEILHEAMVKGNLLYDRYRRSLPHRYCSIHEVADQMAEICPFTVKEERPVSIENDHQMSTLKGQLEFLMLFKQRFAVIYVCEEKSSVFCSDGKKIGFVDSHMHVFRDQIGGAVHIYAEKDLDTFIYSVAEANRLSPTTYGNLTFLKF